MPDGGPGMASDRHAHLYPKTILDLLPCGCRRTGRVDNKQFFSSFTLQNAVVAAKRRIHAHQDVEKLEILLPGWLVSGIFSVLHGIVSQIRYPYNNP